MSAGALCIQKAENAVKSMLGYNLMICLHLVYTFWYERNMDHPGNTNHIYTDILKKIWGGENSENYVNHYLLLEKDFEETKQYVTIAEDNFEAYSVAYLKLLLTIGSEIDVMLEVVAKEYDVNSSENGFGCSKVLLEHEPDVKKLEIMLKDENVTILPWDCDRIPEWWTAYNEIKHNRYEEAKKFNSSKKTFNMLIKKMYFML